MMANLVFDFRHHYETGERRASEPCAYQYDQGHIAKVYVPETADEFEMHYAWGDFPLSEGYTVDDVEQADDGGYVITAHIPNDLFERSGELRVYVVASDTNSIITTYEGYIFIKNRVQPDDYVDDDPDNHATKILDEAQRYATKSESFAVGGTGTRLGEDTDNAKYYLEQAEEVAESIPEDYTALSNEVEELEAEMDTKAPTIYCTTSGSLVTIPDGADSMPLKSLTVDVEAVQSGSGDPSPQNMRAISGWTGCKVTRTGKNLFDKTSPSVRNGYPGSNTYVSSSGQRSIVIPCRPNTTYTASKIAVNSDSSDRFGIFWAEESIASGVSIYGVQYKSTNFVEGQKYSFTVTTGENARYLGVWLSRAAEYADSLEVLQIETGSTATEYEAYTGETYDITFPDSAGTVYGGTVDPVAGKLLDDYDWAIAQADGTFKRKNGSTLSGSGYRTGGYVIYQLGASGSVRGYAKCNMYPIGATAHDYGVVVCSASSESRMTFCDTSVPGWTEATSNAALFSAWTQYVADQYAQGNILFVIWRNRTAVEYDIDPVTIRTLLGLNNIWADCGDIAECVYAADTKMYIENLTKPTEDDMVANAAIEAGKFFMIGNRLFLSTASIANGATITPGTNATEMSLSEALNSLN